ncbi:uncharacterized protein etaa1b [Chaetodon auriga]|uniref:uncharacterized protein etaa1b n=1 Tax=Chaetodon auriga TaxID=39042 RepID=UPI004032B5BC
MSGPAAGAADFHDLWSRVSKLCHSKTQDLVTGKQMPGTATSPVRKGFQSPKGSGCSRYPSLNNGDSPGDVEPSQDIFWDATSPTPASTGLRNCRVVEISDIVDRIAPKDVKRKESESPLLQWIGDSAVSCTPDIPKSRVRKRSSRQSSVEDLMKLAKQFDKNMQQDRETSEELNTVNNNPSERGSASTAKLTETSISSSVRDLKCPNSLDQVESELHALFDCSTQGVSGRLSQGSSVSACSQEIRAQPVSSTSSEPRQSDCRGSTSSEPRQSELKSADRSGPAARPAEEKGSCGSSANNCDDFDDDWENDDLLNDSFVLAMTQDPDQQHDTNLQSNTKTNTTQFTSACKPTANTNSAHQRPTSHSKPSATALQELCPKPKTTNRSTFKLEPNPHFQPREESKSGFTVTQPKPQMSTTKTLSTPQPDKITKNQEKTCVAACSVKDISDSLWDDGDDDALLYQVCDRVERISNSQPQQVIPSSCQEKQYFAVERQRKTTAPLPIDAAGSTSAGASANRQSPCAFVRSNSLPETSCKAVNYQGWNAPMKGANNKSRMSQSLPGSHMSLGTFSQCGDSSGTFQRGNANVDVKQQTVTATAPQNSRSHHMTFKRNVSDSAVISSKVFVTSQMTGKCSSPEIERKKQEALARRRLRMQNAPKP